MALTSLRRVLASRSPIGRPHHRLLLVTDEAGWILDEVAAHLSANLPAALRTAVVTSEWLQARSCTIHFVNRVWAWSDGLLDRVHPSNRLIGLWWHGRADSPFEGIQAALARVRLLHERFWRMQVTCSIGRNAMLTAGVPAEKIVILPEGIDLQTFRPAASAAARQEMRRALRIPAGAVAIGCFQKDGEGWEEGAEPKMIKGPDVLVDVLVRLRRRYPVHAVIPGPARGYVRRRLDAAEVPFSAPGLVPRVALPRLYHALDAYLSPSRDEGGPAGVLESMASGVPVVSTRAGMPADIIDDGVNGGLADVDDVEGLVGRIAAMIDDASMRARVAALALDTVRSFDWRILGPRYAEELYGSAPA